MTVFKVESREKKIKDLMTSFSNQYQNNQKPIYKIDKSYHHAEIQNLSKGQKQIINKAINNYVQKQRKQLQKMAEGNDQKTYIKLRKSLLHSAKKYQISKSTSFFSAKKRKDITPTPQNKSQSIYIERKYNHQISYQIHSFIQAKKIEDERMKVLEKLNKTQQSPLIIETMKQVHQQRLTFQNQRLEKVNHFPQRVHESIHKIYGEENLKSHLKRTLKKLDIQSTLNLIQNNQSNLSPIHNLSSNKHRPEYLKRSYKFR